MELTPIDPRTLLSAQRPQLDPAAKKIRDLETLRSHTREFEAIFLNEMFKAMRKTVPTDGLFEQDVSSEMYQEMLDMQMARESTKGRGIGLGQAMFDQLKYLIEDKLDK